jgi:hypothetical protein
VTAFAAPEDYGEVHDVYAVEGERVARGGFRIMRNVTVSPRAGRRHADHDHGHRPGLKTYESTIALRYDNQFSGICRPSPRGHVDDADPAAGRTGKHATDINHGAKSAPYLNNQQSGTAHIPDWRSSLRH